MGFACSCESDDISALHDYGQVLICDATMHKAYDCSS